jgi:IclR family mhp operon transcriptional activator
MIGIETIRGLERGLRVLKVVCATTASTLQEIHAATTLPKPTLLRILRTLEQEGMVRRRLADGRYQIAAGARNITSKLGRYDRLAEVAGPILDDLCRRIEWPSDLAVPAGDHMVIKETSRPLSPFVLRHDQIGHKINWLLSGHGRSYLAFCAEAEREDLLELMRRSRLPENQLAFHPLKINRIFAEVRRRGYATRDPSHAGGYYGRAPYSDGLSAIAVPVHSSGRIYGALNVLWLKKAHTIDHMLQLHLEDLQNAARRIAAGLQRETSKD